MIWQAQVLHWGGVVVEATLFGHTEAEATAAADRWRELDGESLYDPARRVIVTQLDGAARCVECRQSFPVGQLTIGGDGESHADEYGSDSDDEHPMCLECVACHVDRCEVEPTGHWCPECFPDAAEREEAARRIALAAGGRPWHGGAS